MKILVYREADRWQWVLRKHCGAPIAECVSGFRSYDEALESVRLLQKSCDAFIYDVQGSMLESPTVARSLREVIK